MLQNISISPKHAAQRFLTDNNKKKIYFYIYWAQKSSY